MKSVHTLSLSKEDIKDALVYWVSNFHGLCFDSDAGDKVTFPQFTDPKARVILKDTL